MKLLWITTQGAQTYTEGSDAQTEGFLWIDVSHETIVQQPDAWQQHILKLTGVSLHALHVQDAVSTLHPSYFEYTDEYDMLVFRSLALDAEAKTPLEHAEYLLTHGQHTIPTHPVVFFLLDHALISVRSADDPHLSDIQTRLLNTPPNRQQASTANFTKTMPDTPTDMCLLLVNIMVDRYLLLRQPLTQLLDRWQRELLNPQRKFHDWSSLLDARMSLRHLENLCEEQYDAIQELRDESIYHHSTAQNTELSTSTNGLRIRLNDVLSHIERVQTHAERMETSIENTVQLHFSATAHHTNEIMRIMTMVTVLFMPLTLITGIFGMNFQGMPLLNKPYGFWLTISTMIGVALASIVWFFTRRFIRKLPAIDLHSLSKNIKK